MFFWIDNGRVVFWVVVVIAQAPNCYCYYLKSHHNGIFARAQILRSDNVLDFVNILAVACKTLGVVY